MVSYVRMCCEDVLRRPVFLPQVTGLHWCARAAGIVTLAHMVVTFMVVSTTTFLRTGGKSNTGSDECSVDRSPRASSWQCASQVCPLLLVMNVRIGLRNLRAGLLMVSCAASNIRYLLVPSGFAL